MHILMKVPVVSVNEMKRALEKEDDGALAGVH